MNLSLHSGTGSRWSFLADTRAKKILWILWFLSFSALLVFLLWLKDVTT